MNLIQNFYAFLKRTLHSIHLLVFALLIPIIFSSCNPVSSEEEAAPIYVWKSYNLNKIYNNKTEYWELAGSSLQNILVTTFAQFKSIISYNTLVDSITFNQTMQLPSLYGGSAIHNLNSVLFSAPDCNIYQSVNGELTLYKKMNKPNFSISNITKFFSDENSNLYAIGTYTIEPDQTARGCILKIEDNNYKMIASANTNFTQFRNISKSNNNKYYITSNDSYDSSYTCLYEFDGLTLNKLYKNDSFNDIFINMLQINNRTYFAFNKKLYSYTNKNFTPVIDFSNLPTYINQIYGTSLNNLFLSTREALYQYTGSSLKKVYSYSSLGQIQGALIFEKDVFLLALIGYNTPDYHFELIHGHLK